VLEFLTLDEVLDFHDRQITRYGGSAGIRDLGLLQSALAMPQASFGGVFAHADVFEMAGAYLFHLAKNHPFVDGNKRTAALAAHVFLDLNGWSLGATSKAYEDLVVRVAEGSTDKAGAAAFFRRHARRRRPRRGTIEEE
jgi:death-on-curing protein